MRAARWLAARVADVLYAASDRDHRARGWEVRRGAWGGRRYRLNVRAWLDAQRRIEDLGSPPGPVLPPRGGAGTVDRAADRRVA